MGAKVVTGIVIARPPAEVAASAADPLNAPRWYVNIVDARWVTEPGMRQGGPRRLRGAVPRPDADIHVPIIEYEPVRTLVMRTAEGPFPIQTT